MKGYRSTNSVHLRAYAKAYDQQRCATDQNYRLAMGLRKRLGTALRQNEKVGSAVQDLGCSIAELRAFLEAKFQPGMTWANWSRSGWHIDHVVPLASFDLSELEQFRISVHYTNLQPLWSVDNLRKGSRV